jgi:LPS-assembly lipoprotein
MTDPQSLRPCPTGHEEARIRGLRASSGLAHRRGVLVMLSATLTGCGFELKRAPELRFKSVQLAGFGPKSPLAEELRMNINASKTTQVVETLAQAQVVLEALADAREKSVVASTAAGQVRELQLRARLNFRLRSAAGKELIAATEIMLSRDMSYSESAALAKEQEEALLFKAMQSDIVSQVMRRLASVQVL